jgi:hypothetical protein
LNKKSQALCLAFVFAGLLCLTLMLSLLSGCAVGFTTDQYGNEEAVLGVTMGTINKTIEVGTEAAKVAFPWAETIAGVTGLLGVGGTAAAVHYRTKRNSERAGWEEAEKTISPSSAPTL